MKSVWNKILRVDLTNGTCKPEQVPDDIYEKFLGGAGMSAYMLWRESPRGTTAFDPANRLTFAPGPMQGLKQTGAAKWAAGAISPSINLNADSAATAYFGIEMKEAGYDGIVVHGRAKPGYHAKLRDTGRFANMLLDLADYVSPRLSIMDAVVGMEGDGPSGGTPRNVGLLIGAVNPLALDVVAGEIMGLDPTNNPVLTEAEKRGMTPTNIEDVELIDGGSKSRVKFSVDKSLSLYQGTTAHIRYLDLIGNRYLDLRRGDSNQVLAPGGTIPVDRTEPALDLDALVGGFRPLFRSLDPQKVNTIASSLVTIFQGEGGTINNILDQTASFSSTIGAGPGHR